MLPFQPVQPFAVGIGCQRGLGRFGQLREVPRVTRAHVLLLARRGEPLERVLAHRLEHREPRAAAGSRSRLCCASAPSSGAPIEHTSRAAASSQPPAKTASRANAARSGSASSRWLQSIVARSVRWRSGASRGPPAASVEPPRQAASSIAAGARHAAARRGQLDRQRQPVEPAADLRDRAGASSSTKPVAGGPRSRDEQLDRGGVARGARRLGQGQRRDRVLVLAVEAQQRPARDQHLQRRRRRRAAGDDRRGRVDVLEVVEHEQRPARREVVAERLDDRPIGALGDPERVARSRRRRARGPRGRERDEVDAVREAVREVGRGLDREPRLARAARPGERDEPDVVAAQQRHDLGDRRRAGRPATSPAPAGAARPQLRRSPRGSRPGGGSPACSSRSSGPGSSPSSSTSVRRAAR